MLRIEWVQPSRTVLFIRFYQLQRVIYLAAFFFFCRGLFNNWRWCFFLLLLFLNGNKEADNILALDHVVLINLKFSEDIINLSLGHLVSPGHESVGEHLGIDLALLVVSLESLDNEVIRVISISSHLLLEHLDHVVVGAGTSNLTKETIKLSLAHEDTNIVKGTTEVIFVKLAILVDVHKLEAVLVHLELLLGEPALVLALAHLGVVALFGCINEPPCCSGQTPH